MPYANPDQQRAYQNAWIQRRRTDWLLVNGPCVDCGCGDLDQLRVDHADARLKVSHRVWSWSAERREAELAKCVARCLPCHVTKTVTSSELAQTCGAGARNGNRAKLTEDSVRYIRSSSKTDRELGKELGVNRGTVNLVRRGLRWKHVI
jgi:hypothetical protein